MNELNEIRKRVRSKIALRNEKALKKGIKPLSEEDINRLTGNEHTDKMTKEEMILNLGYTEEDVHSYLLNKNTLKDLEDWIDKKITTGQWESRRTKEYTNIIAQEFIAKKEQQKFKKKLNFTFFIEWFKTKYIRYEKYFKNR